MSRRFTPALNREVELRDEGSDREVWDATFDHLYHVPPLDTAPQTVLDLGSNIGLTAAHYRALWPEATVVAVEMDAACCDLLRVNAPGVPLWECAVSGIGGAGFYDPNTWSSNFRFNHVVGKPVPSRTLSEIIDVSFEGPVDFVKMDVEGAEWEIFANGEWAPLVRSLLVELHDGGDNMVERAIEELSALGFEARPHDKHPLAVWATR